MAMKKFIIYTNFLVSDKVNKIDTIENLNLSNDDYRCKKKDLCSGSSKDGNKGSAETISEAGKNNGAMDR
jgi:hypothetical protein